jgi:hypothetical protein
MKMVDKAKHSSSHLRNCNPRVTMKMGWVMGSRIAVEWKISRRTGGASMGVS